MTNNERKGHLSLTRNDHLSIGSTGSGFEDLIEGELNPDIPYGEQMSTEALQKYYDDQLGGVRLYFSLTVDQRAPIMSVAEGFEADLPYLRGRGVDTADAELAFEQLRALDGATV